MEPARASRSLLFLVGREVVNILLLIAFVLAVSTMPPVKLQPDINAESGYTIKLDTAQWERSLSAYAALVRSGTLGRDQNGNPVGPLVVDRLVNSLGLLALALLLAVVPGVMKGIHDFRQMRRRRFAVGPLITGIVGGLPDFLLVFLFQYGVVQFFRWSGLRPLPVVWFDQQPLRSLVLPVICLALIPWAYVARVTTVAMGEIWEQDYIRTAWSKGVSEGTVLYRHALRNAALRVLDGFPNLLTIMLSNLLIVEWLFHFPGLTILLKDAVNPASALRSSGSVFGFSEAPPDIPVLVASGMAIGLVFSLLYLALAVLRRLADPRLKGGANA
ncbi:MAG TPA: ABC transporter permease [Symbiobacteriaceae bacterium]|jgi:ABC-type dipeptide/oligopeptide/nickel transport system permease component